MKIAILSLFFLLTGVADDRAPMSCRWWAPQDGDWVVQLRTHVRCLQLPAGTFPIRSSVIVGPKQELRGSGPGTVIKAIAEHWKVQSSDSVLQFVGDDNVVRNLTVDASGVASYDAAGSHFLLDKTDLMNGRAGGVGIAGTNVVILRSRIHSISKDVNVPGRGLFNCEYAGSIKTGLSLCTAIYAQGGEEGTGTKDYAPQIIDSEIYDIGGPAVDMNRVDGGTILGTVIDTSASWASISLYGASRWTIKGNRVKEDHSVVVVASAHRELLRFGRAAALYIGTDDAALPANNNTVEDNYLEGYFGILLAGVPARGIRPRGNTFKNNILDGSVVRCYSDQRDLPVYPSCDTR